MRDIKNENQTGLNNSVDVTSNKNCTNFRATFMNKLIIK